MTENIQSVAIGKIVASGAPDNVLVAYGIGSCVAVCLYDPVARVGGVLHALLPTAPGANGQNKGNSAKFVDQGTPLLVEALLKLGARRSRLIAYLCGGARVLSALDLDDFLNIGERNVLAAESALRTEHIRVQARATGGRIGRTVRLYVVDGRVTVKSLKHGEQALIPVANSAASVKRERRAVREPISGRRASYNV